jgi:hypothetical protein
MICSTFKVLFLQICWNLLVHVEITGMDLINKSNLPALVQHKEGRQYQSKPVQLDTYKWLL